MVQRNGMLIQALEILLAQADGGRPQDALVLFLGKPEVECSDKLRIDLYGPAILDNAHAYRGRSQAGELVFERFELLPVGFQSQRAAECRHRSFDIDDSLA